MDSAEVARIFEECWEEAMKIYTRAPPIWCSEKDLQAYLYCKLSRKLKEVNQRLEEQFSVYVEMPISLDPEMFFRRMSEGRPRRARKVEVYIADIAIIGWEKETLYQNPYPSLYLIAELKYQPTTLIPIDILTLAQEEELEDHKLTAYLLNNDGELIAELERNTRTIREWRRSGPTKSDLDYYLGRGKSKPQIRKMIDIMKAYKNEHEVYGYLCILEDLYPDLDSALLEEIKQYDPPPQFRILFKYMPLDLDKIEALIHKLHSIWRSRCST